MILNLVLLFIIGATFYGSIRILRKTLALDKCLLQIGI